MKVNATKLFIGTTSKEAEASLRDKIIENGILGLDKKIITFYSVLEPLCDYARNTTNPVFILKHFEGSPVRKNPGNIVAGIIKNANPHSLVYQYGYHKEEFLEYNGFIKVDFKGMDVDLSELIQFLKNISYIEP